MFRSIKHDIYMVEMSNLLYISIQCIDFQVRLVIKGTGTLPLIWQPLTKSFEDRCVCGGGGGARGGGYHDRKGIDVALLDLRNERDRHLYICNIQIQHIAPNKKRFRCPLTFNGDYRHSIVFFCITLIKFLLFVIKRDHSCVAWLMEKGFSTVAFQKVLSPLHHPLWYSAGWGWKGGGRDV